MCLFILLLTFATTFSHIKWHTCSYTLICTFIPDEYTQLLISMHHEFHPYINTNSYTCPCIYFHTKIHICGYECSNLNPNPKARPKLTPHPNPSPALVTLIYKNVYNSMLIYTCIDTNIHIFTYRLQICSCSFICICMPYLLSAW